MTAPRLFKQEVPAWFVILSIVCLLAVAIHLFSKSLEYQIRDHYYHLVGMYTFDSGTYNYMGLCRETSVLLGIFYNMLYNKSFYIVDYIDTGHTILLVNGTAYSLGESNIGKVPLVYKCTLNDSARRYLLYAVTRDTSFKTELPRNVARCVFTPTIPSIKEVREIYAVTVPSRTELAKMYENRYSLSLDNLIIPYKI